MKYQKRDKKGRFAKTDMPLKYMMRVTAEEKDLILQKRIEQGTTHMKTFIKATNDTQKKRCYFCRSTDHKLYFMVGKECLDEFVSRSGQNFDRI